MQAELHAPGHCGTETFLELTKTQTKLLAAYHCLAEEVRKQAEAPAFNASLG